jgi:hypothetical protein
MLRNVVSHGDANANREPLAQWQAVARQLEAWDGDVDSGRALVESMRALEDLRGPASGLEAVRSFRARLRKLAKGDVDPVQALKLWEVSETALRLLHLAPDVKYPWDDTERLVVTLHALDNAASLEFGGRIADLAASVLAEPASQHAPSARAWLWISLTLRERDHWVPAAVALSRHLATLPDGHPDRSTGARDQTRSLKKRHEETLEFLISLRRDGSRSERAAALVTSEGRDDHHTRTAMVLAALIVASEPSLREASLKVAERGLRRIVAEPGDPLDYQVWDLFRRFTELKAGAVEPFVPDVLLGWPWPEGKARGDADLAEALHDGCETLRWLEGSGSRHLPPELRTDWRERLLNGRLKPAAGQLRGLTDPRAPRSDCLREALAGLRSERWRGSPSIERCGHLIAAFRLLEAPDLQGHDWHEVATALGAEWICQSSGAVGDVARADLFALAASRDALFTRAIHSREAAAGPVSDSGLRLLLRYRWRCDSGRWRPRGLATKRAAGLVARHLMQRSDAEAQLAGVLELLTRDAPPFQPEAVESVLIPGKSDYLWQQVADAMQAPWPARLNDLIKWETNLGEPLDKSGGGLGEALERRFGYLTKGLETFAGHAGHAGAQALAARKITVLEAVMRAARSAIDALEAISASGRAGNVGMRRWGLEQLPDLTLKLLEWRVESSSVSPPAAMRTPLDDAAEWVLQWMPVLRQANTAEAAAIAASRRTKKMREASEQPAAKYAKVAEAVARSAETAASPETSAPSAAPPPGPQDAADGATSAPTAAEQMADAKRMADKAVAEAQREEKAAAEAARKAKDEARPATAVARDLLGLWALESPRCASPLVDADTERIWREALAQLDELVREVPLDLKCAVDVIKGRVIDWLRAGAENARRGAVRRAELREAMASGAQDDDALVRAIVAKDAGVLREVELREVGNYFLGRLDLGGAPAGRGDALVEPWVPRRRPDAAVRLGRDAVE